MPAPSVLCGFGPHSLFRVSRAAPGGRGDLPRRPPAGGARAVASLGPGRPPRFRPPLPPRVSTFPRANLTAPFRDTVPPGPACEARTGWWLGPMRPRRRDRPRPPRPSALYGCRCRYRGRRCAAGGAARAPRGSPGPHRAPAAVSRATDGCFLRVFCTCDARGRRFACFPGRLGMSAGSPAWECLSPPFRDLRRLRLRK